MREDVRQIHRPDRTTLDKRRRGLELGWYEGGLNRISRCRFLDGVIAAAVAPHFIPGRVLGGESAPSRKIQLGHILENEPLLERIWNQTDAHAYMFVYQCLLSF